ncbi:MAG: two-component system response regulator [Alkalinema sp. CACIAM 70d]|nr:MAG: two-component system response regulator [Alkalinema sp. CACIAM 70d]
MDKVLIVEDTVSEMELLSHYLREDGYTVIGTANAKEALQMALDHKPDIVVSDVVMPGMSGFEFCRSLRKHPETANVPVILCTSKSQDIDRLWGMKQGANAYITKPFTREVLLQAIQQAIQTVRL